MIIRDCTTGLIACLFNQNNVFLAQSCRRAAICFRHLQLIVYNVIIINRSKLTRSIYITHLTKSNNQLATNLPDTWLLVMSDCLLVFFAHRLSTIENRQILLGDIVAFKRSHNDSMGKLITHLCFCRQPGASQRILMNRQCNDEQLKASQTHWYRLPLLIYLYMGSTPLFTCMGSTHLYTCTWTQHIWK